MPRTYRYLLHEQGPALWPAHKPLAEVMELKHTTPEGVWEATYQGNATPPGGAIFQREWWNIRESRYDPDDIALRSQVYARWISWDTASKTHDNAAYSAWVVVELLSDYRVAVREVGQERLSFANLPDEIERLATKYSHDGKLRGVLIEDKSTGTSAYQTLTAKAPAWLVPLLIPFMPHGSKELRAGQASVWCKNGCVLLPRPGPKMPWLFDFEDTLFKFPGVTYMDMVDAFTQALIFLEHLLSEGYQLRTGAWMDAGGVVQ